MSEVKIIVTTEEVLTRVVNKAVEDGLTKYKLESQSEGELLTIPQVCELLKRSKSWLARCKELKPQSKGKRNTRYNSRDVKSYMQSLHQG